MKIRNVIAHFGAILLLLLVLCASVYGQAGFGTIAGKISDPSGAVIAGANVVATNADTNQKTEVKSNSTGEYQVLQLPPGPYTLQVDASGFKKLKRDGITVRVADRLTIDLALTVGENREIVSVTAEAPLLRAQDAQTGEVVTATFIENLPQLQRDPLQLLVISSNVQGDGSRAEGGNGTGGSDTRINGGRTSGIEYLVDGVTAGTGVGHGVAGSTPRMDAVAEFKVITNGISAEYGRMSGGGVELVTKSGGNQLHGQVFEYLQNDKLNANSWAQNALGGERTPFRRNDFGFAVGGPVWLPKIYKGRDKTFFFANYEGVRFSQAGLLQTTSVPTELERGGDFTQTQFDGVPAMMFDPDVSDSTFRNVTNPDGTISQFRTVLLGGDGKHVPVNRMSPMALALQKLVPLPSPGMGRSNSSSADNFVAPQDTASSLNAFSARIDQNFSENHRLFGRFSHETYTNLATPWRGPLSTGAGSQNPGAFTTTLNYDWTLSPTLIFSTRLGATFSPLAQGNMYASGVSTASLPLDSTTRTIVGSDANLPIIHSYAGNMNTRIADSPISKVQNSATYNAVASLTKILAKHTVKLGFETRRYYDNFIDSGSPGWPWTGYWLSNANPVNETIGDGPYDNQANANAYGAFLLGRLGHATLSGSTNRAEAFNYYSGYVQDDIRVTSKLTLNVGLRWDMETPLTERYDRFYFWDPDATPQFTINPGFNWNTAMQNAGVAGVAAPGWVANGLPKGAIRLPNTPEFPSRKPFGYHPFQFAPRFGFAYQIGQKTVLRGSFGQMYMSAMANPNSARTDPDISIGDSADGGWHRGGFAHYASTLDDPYNQVSHYTRSNEVANFQVSGDNTVVSAFNKNQHMPYEFAWSFGIQHQLPKGFLVEATYSANQGHGLLAPLNISQFPRSLFTPANAAVYDTQVASPFIGQRMNTSETQQLSRLIMAYPQYGPMKILGNNVGRSNYNSLNLRAERRLWQGMTFLVNYTYAKMLDNVGGAEANADNSVDGGRGGKIFQSVDSINDVYGYSPYDEKHRLAATYSIELPIGRGKRVLGSPNGAGPVILDGLIGGWQFAGTTIFRSGRPVIFGFDGANVNNPWGIEYTFGSYATTDTDLRNPSFAGNSHAIFSSQDAVPAGAGVFDKAKFLQPKTFTYGTLPAVYGNIRNPGNINWDLSLMKKFPFTKDSGRYLQFRLEALNAFNLRGFGGYDTTVGSPNFGVITSAGNTERRAQVSARIMF